MLKPKLQNIIIFIFVKYIVFYIFIMFKNNNYSLIRIEKLKNFQDLLYYFILFLSLPIIFSILFIIPLNYALKTRNNNGFILSVLGILIFEYLIYTYLASQTNFLNGIYNCIITTLILILFFFKSIKENLTS